MTQETPNPDASADNDQNKIETTDEAASAVSTDERTLAEQLEAARNEAVDNLDKFLRAKAESENIRRRSAEDAIKARKFAVEQFAGDLLAVRDSLELASQVSLVEDNPQALQQMHEGLALTLKQLDSAFEKSSIRAIDPAGDKFDPRLHQAVSMTASDEVEPNHVVSVLQKGYVLNERLLRPAMVVVAKAPGETAEPDAQVSDESGGNEA